MKEPIMVDFPVQEYEERVKKILIEMDKNDLDALILTTKENTNYFCGFRMITWDSKISKPGALVITRKGDLTLVGANSGYATMNATSYVEDIRGFDTRGRGGLPKSFPEAIFKVLEEKGYARGRIGMELGTGFRLHLTPEDYKNLMNLLSGATLVDAAPSIWELRAVKSPLEIERMRKVCDINIKAFEKALRSIHLGMTERELFRLIGAEMFKLGADDVFPLGIRAGKERYAQGNCPPGDRPIGKGEIVLIDGGPGYRGYYSDIIREACIGEPTSRQKELFNFSVEACMTGIKKVKAGVTAREVTEAIDNFVDKSDFVDTYVSRGGCGHSIGLDIHEVPMISVNNEQPLKAGMIIAIEPSFYEEGMGMFNIEENLLVTEEGYEILTPLDHDLWIL